MFKPIHIIASLGILFSALTAVASNPVNYDTSKWTIHQAFENKPRKIIDTPDAVYFLVHPLIFHHSTNGYDKGNHGYYSQVAGSLLFYDKNNPEAGIQDLAKKVYLAGNDIRLASYNPVLKSLVIAYNDGGIEIVSPDRTSSTYISDLKKRVKSGGTTISAINFDYKNGDIWLGTGAGFAQISGTSLKILRAPEWGDAVTDIVPVGNNIVAVIGSKILMAPLNSNIASRDSYSTPTISGSYGTVLNLMTLSDNAFATVNTSGQIRWLSFSNNKWTVTNPNIQNTASNVLSSSSTTSFYVVNRIDHTVTPTANGFYIAAKDRGYFINRPTSLDAKPTFTYAAFPEEKGVYNGSWDGQDFWFYQDTNNFVSQTFDGTEWKNKDNLITQAPQTTHDNFILHSPTQGLIVVNRHPNINTNYYSDYQNPLVSAYKDGVWRDLSPCHFTPAIALTDPLAESQRNSKISNKWPVSMPLGAAVDPLNPNMLFISSPYHPGFAGIYLDDPTKTPLIVVREGDATLSAYNALQAIEPSPGWLDFGPTLCLGTDEQGTMWFYYNSNETANNRENQLFYAITPEGRSEAIQLADPFTKHFDVQPVVSKSMRASGFWVYGTACKHPSNRNKLITTTSEGDKNGLAIRVFDHNGTFEDQSDDKITYIRKFRMPNGDLQEPTGVRDIVENPVTGDIIVPAFHDTFIFNLSDPVENETINARPVGIISENGQTSHFRPATRAMTAVADEYGRLWVATYDDGVIGISTDGKSVVANYNSFNSPIGNDEVHGLGWNPDTKSLFISARNVIAEVRVDDPDTSGESFDINSTFITPTFVNPEYAGTVAIHNVPAGVTLRIRDSKGKTIREIDSPANGLTYWDLLDSEGRRVPSDRYTIMDASGNEIFKPILLPVVR